MATAAVQIPSHNRLEPGSSKIQAIPYPKAYAVGEVDVKAVVAEWTNKLNGALSNRNYALLNDLFLKDSCWRDQLGLSWDYHTLHGPEKMISFLQESGSNGSRIRSLVVDNSNATRQPTISAVDPGGKVKCIASFITMETDVGRGRGLIRLVQDPEDDGKWKGFTLFTAMHELRGHEETVKANRPQGVDHGGQPGRKNWQDRRHAMENFEDGNEPTVLVIGMSRVPYGVSIAS